MRFWNFLKVYENYLVDFEWRDFEQDFFLPMLVLCRCNYGVYQFDLLSRWFFFCSRLKMDHLFVCRCASTSWTVRFDFCNGPTVQRHSRCSDSVPLLPWHRLKCVMCPCATFFRMVSGFAVIWTLLTFISSFGKKNFLLVQIFLKKCNILFQKKIRICFSFFFLEKKFQCFFIVFLFCKNLNKKL